MFFLPFRGVWGLRPSDFRLSLAVFLAQPARFPAPFPVIFQGLFSNFFHFIFPPLFLTPPPTVFQAYQARGGGLCPSHRASATISGDVFTPETTGYPRVPSCTPRRSSRSWFHCSWKWCFVPTHIPCLVFQIHATFHLFFFPSILSFSFLLFLPMRKQLRASGFHSTG